MDKAMLRAVLACFLLVVAIPIGHALDSGTVRSIRAATFRFEAPGAGIVSEGLGGTAFAIGPNEFVTAAHLFTETIGGYFGRPELTDSDQVRYRIGDILQFSEQQDYVIFSLEHPPTIRPLAVRRNDQTAHDLYFAGWRSGGTIAIAHGTFSGLTRDAESGDFDWLRFSGEIWNSVGGGPVLDDSGYVIGIVQARSRVGEANFAVPIGALPVGTPGIAHIHSREMLRSLLPTLTPIVPLEGEIPLPMSYEKFSHELQQLRLAYFDREIRPLLEATRRNFVLTGAGAEDMCNLLNGKTCQCRARTGASGELVLDNPGTDELIQRVNTGENVSEKIAGVALVRTRERDVEGIHEHDLSRDSLRHLSLALKAQADLDVPLEISKKIASRTVADQDGVYVDFRDRTWYLRTWPLGIRDLAIISLARQLPDGYVVLTRVVPTALSYAAALQVKFVANLVYFGCDELPGEGDVRVADTMGR